MTKYQILYKLDGLNKQSKNNLKLLQKQSGTTDFITQAPITLNKIEMLRLKLDRNFKEAEHTKMLLDYLEKKFELSKLPNTDRNGRKILNLELEHAIKELDYNLYLENNQTRINALLAIHETFSIDWDKIRKERLLKSNNRNKP